MEEKEKTYPLWMQVQRVSPCNRKLAMIYCLLGFVGLGGMQRFYVRRWISGFIYLFSFGVLGLGTIYDLVQLYRGKFEDNRGLALESMVRKRWDTKNAIWRYAGWSVACGLYFVNRETIRWLTDGCLQCSYLVQLNRFGASHIEAAGLKNVVYVISDVEFENRSDNIFVTYHGSRLCDTKGNVITTDPVSGTELAKPDSMNHEIYRAVAEGKIQ